MIKAGFHSAPRHLSDAETLGHDGEAACATAHVAEGPAAVDEIRRRFLGSLARIRSERDNRFLDGLIQRHVEGGTLAALAEDTDAAAEVDRERSSIVEAQGLQGATMLNKPALISQRGDLGREEAVRDGGVMGGRNG